MKKPFYVTTPLYYVNAKPHIGHAYTTVAADVLVRFKKLMGYDTFFLTGTDEHGQKVAQASQKAGLSPQKFTDQLSGDFRELWKLLGIEYDDFIRTTEERHVRAVRRVWEILHERGDIEVQKYKGWYDSASETFLSYREFKEGGYADNPKLRQNLEEIEEENYFFKLSKHQAWLIDYIRSHKDFIYPSSRRNETLSFLENNELNDLCISRPKSRLTWGIETPLSSEHVTYVWFDALINYISACGFPDQTERLKRYWPALHLIGKDILRPHTVYWPIMLHAIGIEPPRMVFAHGWWMVDQEKMSKSLGNVVNPLDVVKEYGRDPFRYFLLREVTFGQDGCYSDQAMTSRYNVDLANNLGNLLQRSLSMLMKYCDGKTPNITAPQNELSHAAKGLAQRMEQALDQLQYQKALGEIWQLIDQANRFIETQAPWKLYKAKEQAKLETVMLSLCEVLRLVAQAIWPFMPDTAVGMWSQLGLDPAQHVAPSFREKDWGYLKPGTQTNKAQPLFPRLDPVS